MSEGSFFAELRKRKVFQVAAIYGAIAWGVTEIIVTVTEQLFLPHWVSTLAAMMSKSVGRLIARRISPDPP